MKQNNISEFEALTNAIKSNNLTGFTIKEYIPPSCRNVKYVLVDDTGTSLTGTWDYEKVNHFIMGYGKALKSKQQPIYKIVLHDDYVYIKGHSGLISVVTDTRLVHDKDLITELEPKFIN